MLVAHDTNIVSIAGALGLSWLVDGRRDDTPPGGALVFELWMSAGSSEYSVRTFYMAQTLEQMRNRTPLSLKSLPSGFRLRAGLWSSRWPLRLDFLSEGDQCEN